LVISWSGMRGLISLAAALALPETIADGQAFPARALVQFLSFAVILATLVVQGLSLGALIRLLGVKADTAEDEEERTARIEAANAAIAAIDRLGEDPAIPRAVIEQIRMLYINRLEQLSEPDRAGAPGSDAQNPDYANVSDSLRLAAISAERNALREMRRRRAVGDGPLRVMESELDLMETVLSRRGATYSRIGGPRMTPERSLICWARGSEIVATMRLPVDETASQLGSSSPGRGSSPPPSLRKARAAALSPRPSRAVKNSSSVSIAETFSAAAMTRNWFKLAPSAPASRSTAAFNDKGSRTETVTDVSSRLCSRSFAPPTNFGINNDQNSGSLGAKCDLGAHVVLARCKADMARSDTGVNVN
jgi:hypothetical protein